MLARYEERISVVSAMLRRRQSPIVAAALCVMPRGLLTANQAAKVDAMKKDWLEFTTMRRLAMRFRGMLKGKSVGKLGGWLRDALRSRINVSLARCRETSTRCRMRSRSRGATARGKDKSIA
jgi:hypothetical protein